MSRLGVILCGFITGSVMAVPGISGGSAAMVIGVYDDLLRAVSRCFSEPRRNIPLLLRFALGGILGLFLMAGAISWLLTTQAEVPVRFLFLGAVAGGIPAIFRKAGVRRLNASGLVLILSGAAAVLLLASFPEGRSPRASADSPTWRCNSPAECSWLLRLCCRESARHTSSTCSEFTTP